MLVHVKHSKTRANSRALTVINMHLINMLFGPTGEKKNARNCVRNGDVDDDDEMPVSASLSASVSVSIELSGRPTHTHRQHCIEC